jgi:hypothetical protein
MKFDVVISIPGPRINLYSAQITASTPYDAIQETKLRAGRKYKNLPRASFELLKVKACPIS